MAGIDELVSAEMSRPFVWGECDCGHAVANVLATLGRGDPAAPWRGKWRDEAGALAVLGGPIGEMMPVIAARCGWPEIVPAEAAPGDVGLARGALVIRTERAWVGKGLRGLVVLRRADRAWGTA